MNQDPRPFDDMPDDLDFDRAAPETVIDPSIMTRGAIHEEDCPKCRGTGRFISHAGRDVGPCFSCKGSGKLAFKSSPADRAKAREKSAERKTRATEAAFAAFAEEFPRVARWIEEESPRFEFAASLREAIGRFGHLTDNQLAAAERCIERAEARALAASERAMREAEKAAAAPIVDTSPIVAAFFAASVSGLRRPRLDFGDFVLSRAPDTGKNPGAIYINGPDDQYFGKITPEGRLMAGRDMPEGMEPEILRILEDPKSAAEAYGKRTGRCCVCSRLLTNPVSVEAGIGPICGERFGWAS